MPDLRAAAAGAAGATHPESPPPRPPKRPWHVAMLPRLTLVSLVLGGFSVVAYSRVGDGEAPPTDVDLTMQSHLEAPHTVSERFTQEILPAAQAAAAGEEVNGPGMMFFNAYLPDDESRETSIPAYDLRFVVKGDYGEPGAPLIVVVWEWDDAVIASLNADGDEVVDPQLLEATMGGGYADKLRAAEDEVYVNARAWLDDREWSRTVERWVHRALPFAMLAFFLVLPVAGMRRYVRWMDRHDEAEGGWRDGAPLVPALAAGTSGAGEGEVADDQADAGGAHGQPVHVAAHLDDVEEHPLERGGDGELP